MSVEENIALVRRHTEEFWNKGNLGISDQIHTSDYVFHDALSPELRGIKAYEQFVTMYRAAFPDLHFTEVDVIAAGDKVASRWTCVGTHQGELMGIPPTGKQTTTTGIDIFRIVDGKIAEEWVNWSTMALMQQLGVIPPMGGE
jgi:steroid delta-isomerase-like uncharacterized protein